MGRGWKNTNAKVRIRPRDIPEDVERVYHRIRAYTEECMRTEYSEVLFRYRVRYRNGFPKRIHYSAKVNALHRLMQRLVKYRTCPENALMQLERIKQM